MYRFQTSARSGNDENQTPDFISPRFKAIAKIVFINRYFYPDLSATSQILTDLVLELTRSGRQVHVITSRQDYSEPSRRLKPAEVVGGAFVRRVWTTRFGRAKLFGRSIDYLTFYLSAAYRLCRDTRHGDMLIAKTDPPLISVVVAAVARFRRATLINWTQDLFPEVAIVLDVRGISTVAPLLRLLRNWSLRVARCNVVLGEAMARRLAAEGVPNSSIRVIHNWSNDGTLGPVSRSDNPLRREWGLGSDFTVGYSGNMGRAHEFSTILDAAEALRADDDIRFVFIGGGAQAAYIAEAVRDRNLSNVVFQSYQPRERLSQSLSAADVHLISLLPALEELIVPSKFYGITAVARPVIYVGDPKGEIPKLLERGNCGFTVRPGDTADLVRRIRDLAADPDAAAALGANGRRLLEAEFSRAEALRKWQEVIESAFARSP